MPAAIHLALFLWGLAVILALLLLRRKRAMSALRRFARKLEGYVVGAWPLRSSDAMNKHQQQPQQAYCFATKSGPPKGGGPSAESRNVKFATLAEPTKSARDKKRYKVIRLENGLTACLISDLSSIDDRALDDDDEDVDDDDDDDVDESGSEDGVGESPVDDASGSENESGGKKAGEAKQKMAAAALCVGVGSFSDPAAVPGMAHFLEHMVFMGSEKYPKENDFDTYITKRGGYSNASTDCETTTFHFECFEKYLLRSLDKFAQFFIVPLMKPGSITREREAIESEFQMARPNDEYRKEQLLAALFNPSVPINQFSWGNLATLKENVRDDALYQALHEFRKRHYSAHRMTLAVQARLPLETLQSYVLECFAGVPSNGKPPLDFAQYADVIFDTPEVNKIYYVVPVKNVMQVDLTWALPPLLRLYKSKPQHYVSWLLGHEGKGSLMSQLRKRVWALSMYTGNGESGSEHNSMYSYFTTTLVLTQAGLDHLFEVVELVFSYINLLRRVGPQERIFNEIKLIEDTSFAFADEKEAAEMVETLAENMQFYPSEDYLSGPDLYFEYKPEDIRMVLNHLRPDKVNIMVLNKKMPSDIVCDKVEPWFKTPYTTRDIPNEWLIRWTNVEPLPEFALPEPNRFLTTDFSLLPKIPTNPEYPVKTLATNTAELWYRFDQKFQMPTAFYYYYLISPSAIESPVNASMLDMLTTILAIEFTEEGYPAQVAELEYSFWPGDKGMLVYVSGYAEKLPILLDLITGHIRKIADNLTPAMFEAVKENQSMVYYNKFLKPSTLIKDVRLNLLLNTYWPPIEKHAAIAKVTYEMMRTFAERFVANLYVKGLVQGNVKRETAIAATEKFVKGLGCQPLLPNTFPKIRVVQLPKGEHCCRVFSFNRNDTNSFITNYYQCGPFSLKLTAIIDLVMLIIEEPLFNVLRTKEQLGYSVSCDARDTYRILGYSITVNTQAAKHTTHHVDGRIEAFVKHAQKLLKKMTDKKMAQFKADLIKVKRCADVVLKQEVQRNWNEITSGDYMFDRIEREIKAIEETKAADVKRFWDEHNACGSKGNFRKMSLQVVGFKESTKKHQPGDSATNLGSAPDSEKVRAEYRLSLIGAQSEWKEHRPDDYYVRDIGQFKHNLFLYPSSTSLP